MTAGVAQSALNAHGSFGAVPGVDMLPDAIKIQVEAAFDLIIAGKALTPELGALALPETENEPPAKKAKKAKKEK